MFRRLGKRQEKTGLTLSFKWFGKRAVKKPEKIEPVPPPSNTGLAVRDDSPNQAFPASLRAILKKAIADADELTASIKARAQTEAEAEAKRIIAQANIEAHEIKGKAQIDAQRQADEILSTANKKAQIIEVEARQKVMQLLAAVAVGEEAEQEIKTEYEKAYSRLFSSLQNLIAEGQKIEAELKSKRAKLFETKRLSIEEYGATTLNAPEAIPVETPADETKLEPEIVSKENSEQSVEMNVAPSEKKLEEPTRLETKPLEEKVEQVVKLEEVAQEVTETVEEKATEPLLEKEIAKAHKEPEAEATQQIAEEVISKPPPPGEKPKRREFTPIILDGKTMYTGEVELFIDSAVELKLVSKLYSYLQTVPELKILYTRGSWDQGTTMTVALEKPLPLINILSEAPEVKIVPEQLEEVTPAKERPGSSPRNVEKRVKRIRLALEEAARR